MIEGCFRKKPHPFDDCRSVRSQRLFDRSQKSIPSWQCPNTPESCEGSTWFTLRISEAKGERDRSAMPGEVKMDPDLCEEPARAKPCIRTRRGGLISGTFENERRKRALEER